MLMCKKMMLISMSALVLGACSDTVEEEPTDDEVSTSEVVEDVEAAEVSSEGEVVEEEKALEIVLGQPMELGDYTVTFQSYSLGVDYEGKDALIINYDWVNNSDDTTAPFMSFVTKAFQDGVETGDVFMVDGVDLGIGQSEVKPGAQITGAQDIVAIEDLSKPLVLEVEEMFSFDSEVHSTILDLTTLQ